MSDINLELDELEQMFEKWNKTIKKEIIITNMEDPFPASSIDPDTPTMRQAIENQLKAFFEDSVQFGVTVQSDSYRGAIQNTQDLTTSQFLISFDLTSPTGDITVGSGEIATLGTVSF